MILGENTKIRINGIEVELDECECNIEFSRGIKTHNKYYIEIEVEAGSESDIKLREMSKYD